MSSDEEEDYMSDKLLQQIEDVRPGVPMKKNQEREFQVPLSIAPPILNEVPLLFQNGSKVRVESPFQASKRKAEQNRANRLKKRHVIEEEQRQEGLKKPIDQSNKGINLFLKEIIPNYSRGS